MHLVAAEHPEMAISAAARARVSPFASLAVRLTAGPSESGSRSCSSERSESYSVRGSHASTNTGVETPRKPLATTPMIRYQRFDLHPCRWLVVSTKRAIEDAA